MKYSIDDIKEAEKLDPGTEIILAIIWAVAKDKPKNIRIKYAKIMREVIDLREDGESDG